MHLTKEQVEQDFRRVHTHLPPDRNLVEPARLLAEARAVLREKFLAADVGITGANFLVAETGTSVIVTNEGNGDLTQTLPKAHIVLASIEKLVPTLEDLASSCGCWRVRRRGRKCRSIRRSRPARAAPAIPTGRANIHVVLLDNGRTAMLGGDFRDMLRCIRCGACMNHCPVYHAVGGHAYGWVYPGPMGAVLTPSLIGIDKAGNLPNASTLLRALRERLPGAYSAAEDDALMARARIRAASVARDRPRRPRLLGVLCEAAMALSVFPPPWRPGCWRSSGAPADALLGCRSLPAGPATVTSGAAGRDLPGAMEAPPGGARAAAALRAAAEAAAMTSRDLVLATVRRALGVTGTEAPRRFAVEARLAAHPAGIVPKRGQLPAAERLDLFIRMATAAAATVERVATPEDIPAAVATFLRRHNLPLVIRRGDDPLLAKVPWDRAGTLSMRLGASDGSDIAALSHAFAGVAETGTLVLTSGSITRPRSIFSPMSMSWWSAPPTSPPISRP